MSRHSLYCIARGNAAERLLTGINGCRCWHKLLRLITVKSLILWQVRVIGCGLHLIERKDDLLQLGMGLY
jgi:hypothetical protein